MQRYPEQQQDVAHALARDHMPTKLDISLDAYLSRQGRFLGFVDGEIRIPVTFGEQQSLRGFEKTYRNIIDYIVRITHKIWEDRDVGYIGSTYSNQSQVFDDYGLQIGNTKIIADTDHTTRAFSDIQLIADEIIWAGNDEVGFHTSHRTLIRGTNDGPSKYGPATGKTVDVLVIANCVSRDNVIFLEHVIYNNSSLLLQLGFDLGEATSKLVDAPPAGWPRSTETWDRLRTSARPTKPLHISQPASGFDVDAFIHRYFEGLVSGQAVDFYNPGAGICGTSNRTFAKPIDYMTFWALFSNSLSITIISIDQVYWMGNGADGFMASVRWSCKGPDLYGQPTDAEVQIWGISQFHIRNGKIAKEWTLFNELDLMMQIETSRRFA